MFFGPGFSVWGSGELLSVRGLENAVYLWDVFWGSKRTWGFWFRHGSRSHPRNPPVHLRGGCIAGHRGQCIISLRLQRALRG